MVLILGTVKTYSYELVQGKGERRGRLSTLSLTPAVSQVPLDGFYIA